MANSPAAGAEDLLQVLRVPQEVLDEEHPVLRDSQGIFHATWILPQNCRVLLEELTHSRVPLRHVEVSLVELSPENSCSCLFAFSYAGQQSWSFCNLLVRSYLLTDVDVYALDWEELVALHMSLVSASTALEGQVLLVLQGGAVGLPEAGTMLLGSMRTLGDRCMERLRSPEVQETFPGHAPTESWHMLGMRGELGPDTAPLLRALFLSYGGTVPGGSPAWMLRLPDCHLSYAQECFQEDLLHLLEFRVSVHHLSPEDTLDVQEVAVALWDIQGTTDLSELSEAFGAARRIIQGSGPAGV